ncbi:hypothetical protein F4561_004122 [Lipingzhangella halophila]|uniref:Uncharacterized protein n=1 Tax=Lipingzhangella halophila TaxID=1783352 RepID=A0A7W7RJU8_9ACTN|nr:hypothetical protein [Lipingzhangella halophila]MBB4933302.1 hypothetical protein [Lipingzhangella halophila]
MTVHLITVGLTLASSARRDEAALFGATDNEDLLALLPESSAAFLPESDVAGARRLLAGGLTSGTPEAAALREAVVTVCPDRWSSRASAELTTAARASDPDAVELPAVARAHPDDLVVLVTSDTVPGMHAGLWNALALTGGELDRVRYLDRPDTDSTKEPGRGTVVIAPIPGLDTAGPQGFAEAMRHLGRMGRFLIETLAGPGEHYAFHLSGGYKATLPYLVGLAEGMLGLRERGEVASVRAGLQHEAAPDRLIPLPLRDLPERVLRHELKHAVPDDRGGFILAEAPAAERLLEGYAYELHGKQWRLTPFGEGLLALIS